MTLTNGHKANGTSVTANPNNTVVLVTGARRGIGKGFIESYLSRPAHTVIACVRDPSDSVSQTLKEIPKASGSALIIGKLEATSPTDPTDLVASLQNDYGVTHIDLVISNSGVAKHIGTALNTPGEEMKEHFEINTVGHLLLFQATWEPLLKHAKKGDPKFVVVSSSVGSIGGMENEPVPMLAYGASKAATNFLVRKLSMEHEKEELCVFSIHPGWVGTGMGWYAAKAYGMEAPPPTDAPADPSAVKPLTVEESVGYLLKEIDGASKVKTSGTFRMYDGKTIPW